MKPRAIVLAFVLLLAGACGGTAGTRDDGAGPADIASPDATLPDVPGDADDAARDTPSADPLPDTASDLRSDLETLPSGRAFGDPCASNDDCDSGLCIEGAPSLVCTRACLSGCPDGWACGSRVIGTTAAALCMPNGARLCSPCAVDTDCGAGSCLDTDGRRACGHDCVAGGCPAGYACSSEAPGKPQCVPIGGSCDCTVLARGAERPCAVANPIGTCSGAQLCGAEGWSACSAPTPSVETCNGEDDDCDGMIDEDVSREPAECLNTLDGVGSCEGRWACKGTAGWACVGPEPRAETCNAIDDDCDGSVDEDFRDATGRYVHPEHCGECGYDCATHVPHASVVACDASGSAPVCRPSACDPGYVPTDGAQCAPSMARLCLPCARDTDCTGPGSLCVPWGGETVCGRDCASGSPFGSACPAGYECRAFGDASQCVPASGACTCTPASSGLERACEKASPWGTCRGVETCDSLAGWVGCTAETPAPEACNGADDDCDGLADDALVAPSLVCTNTVPGVGACPGQWSCNGAAGWSCLGPQPQVETCDYADDDCDGSTDEGFVDPAGRYVTPGDCGACGASCEGRIPNAKTVACDASGEVPVCVASECLAGWILTPEGLCTKALSSLCKACADDAACGGGGARCLELGAGRFCGRECGADSSFGSDCPAGFRCADLGQGEAQCVPRSGTCDCTPENAGVVRSCTRSNPEGTCGGTQTCDPSSGWTDCTAREPVAETCNGLDDDCDGFVDAGALPPADPCMRKWFDAAAGTMRTCYADWRCRDVGSGTTWVCDAPTPAAETCNGLDDNCDGVVDEPFTDASGRYTDLAHCGACGRSCLDLVPHATMACDALGPEPRCVVSACAPGYWKASDLSCIPLPDSLCRPCSTTAGCEVPGDVCAVVGPADRAWCVWDCSPSTLHPLDPATGSPCPAGFTCAAKDAAGKPLFKCVPVSGACDCLSGDEGLLRPCGVSNAAGRCEGTQACDPLAGWGVCSAATPAPETCDGEDDDCDGLTDETWTALGTPCEAGIGLCHAKGVVRCSADGTDTACSATAGAPSVEVCDLLDDDCDGATDEDFRDAEGRYVVDAACGSCFTDCTHGWSVSTQHARGRCDAAPDLPVCTYVCEPGWADPDGNAANGCEMAIDGGAVHVATPANGGADTATCGAWDAPCATIGFALGLAGGGGKERVRVSSGVYSESVTLAAGIDLLGGFNPKNWVRDAASNVTVIAGRTAEAPGVLHRKALIGEGISLPTEVSGFTIVGEDILGSPASAGENSYGIWLRNCSSALLVKDVVVYAGRGLGAPPGAAGSAGNTGEIGADGVRGFEDTDGYCTDKDEAAGGSGGKSWCAWDGGSGGDSGCASVGHVQPSGRDGHGFLPGKGGAGGSDYVSFYCKLPVPADAHAESGSDGTSGTDGFSGSAGAACATAEGSAVTGEWVGGRGADGNGGWAGSAGGGGGAGGSFGVVASWQCKPVVGGGGGGGGSGGCGGAGGRSGAPGGGSFGAFVARTSTGPSTLPLLEGCTFVLGEGGSGGAGGPGGSGGLGGAGGRGGTVSLPQAGAGGDGGTGGRGGAGGRGGPGCGGGSFGVYLVTYATVADYCNVAAGNVFFAAGSPGVGGGAGTETVGASGVSAECFIEVLH